MKKIAVYIMAMALAAGSAMAVTSIYWDGSASGNWNNSANWSSTAAPVQTDTLPVSGADEVLQFGNFATANKTINVDVANHTNQLINVTDENDWTFSGQTLNWAQSGFTLAPRIFLANTATGTTTFNNTNHVVSGGPLRLENRSAYGADINMNGPITGDQGVYAVWVNTAAPGTIRLDGDNTFTGGLNVDFSAGSAVGGAFVLGGTLAADNGIAIKTDAGNTGANTFTLESTGTITFNIYSNGFNDGFTSTKVGAEVQAINLDGDFVFELTGAASNAGIWAIVDANDFSVSYGANFSVSSTLGAFSNVGTLWSRTENGADYRFDEATGLLYIEGSPYVEASAALTNFVTDRLTASDAQVFQVEGGNLEGDVTVESSSENFVVSLDDITYSSNVVISVPGTILASTDVYVKVPYGADSGNLNSSLVVSSTNAPNDTVGVSASIAGISLTWDGEINQDLGIASNWVGNLAPTELDDCTVNNNNGFSGDGNWLMTLSTGNTGFKSLDISAAGSGVNAGSLAIRGGVDWGAFLMNGPLVFSGSSLTNNITLQGSISKSLSYRTLGNNTISNNTSSTLKFGEANGFLFSAWLNNNRTLTFAGTGDIEIGPTATFATQTATVSNRRLNRIWTDEGYTGTLTFKEGTVVYAGTDIRCEGGTIKIESASNTVDDVVSIGFGGGSGGTIDLSGATDVMYDLNDFSVSNSATLVVDDNTDVQFRDLRYGPSMESLDITGWAEGLSSIVFTDLGVQFYAGDIAEGAAFSNVTVNGSTAYMTAYTNGAVTGWAVTDGTTGDQFAIWAVNNYPVLSGNRDADYDSDGLTDFHEYALNGNPTNSADTGMQETALDGSDFLYIYAKRTDDASLTYTLVDSPSLIVGPFTDNGYDSTVSGPSGVPNYNMVTNRYDTTGMSAEFVELEIQ